MNAPYGHRRLSQILCSKPNHALFRVVSFLCFSWNLRPHARVGSAMKYELMTRGCAVHVYVFVSLSKTPRAFKTEGVCTLPRHPSGAARVMWSIHISTRKCSLFTYAHQYAPFVNFVLYLATGIHTRRVVNRVYTLPLVNAV